MHVAVIVDEERLVHEHPSLNRLAIGLIGEGVQITRVVPETSVSAGVDQGEQRVALAEKVHAPMRVLPWMRGDRASRIADAMGKSPPDVLYAMGEEAWALGLDLARHLDRPLAIDLWSAGQIRRTPRGSAARLVSAYIAPTSLIAEALRERVDPGLVCHVPLGVALPPVTRQVLAEREESITLAAIGGARDVPAYRAMLAGLSRICREMSQVHMFLELDGPNEHEIWRHAQRLELLDHVSTMNDISQHRHLITRCDLLLVPEQYGEMRSIMLEAMMLGMPVIAANDPFLDMLVDGESASIVSQPEANEWARHLMRLLTDVDAARALGQGARKRVAADHRSTEQVLQLIETFERIASGGTYKL